MGGDDRDPPFFFAKPADAMVTSGGFLSEPPPATSTMRWSWCRPWRRRRRHTRPPGPETGLWLGGGRRSDASGPAGGGQGEGPAVERRQGLRPLRADGRRSADGRWSADRPAASGSWSMVAPGRRPRPVRHDLERGRDHRRGLAALAAGGWRSDLHRNARRGWAIGEGRPGDGRHRRRRRIWPSRSI